LWTSISHPPATETLPSLPTGCSASLKPSQLLQKKKKKKEKQNQEMKSKEASLEKKKKTFEKVHDVFSGFDVQTAVGTAVHDGAAIDGKE
jgi:hypothetical protein